MFSANAGYSGIETRIRYTSNFVKLRQKKEDDHFNGHPVIFCIHLRFFASLITMACKLVTCTLHPAAYIALTFALFLFLFLFSDMSTTRSCPITTSPKLDLILTFVDPLPEVPEYL